MHAFDKKHCVYEGGGYSAGLSARRDCSGLVHRRRKHPPVPGPAPLARIRNGMAGGGPLQNVMSMHGTVYASPRFLKGNACQLLQHSMIVASV